MAFELQNRLVIGLASSALFDLSASDAVFKQKGEEEYRIYQRTHQDDVLQKGVAFDFIKRLLSLNTMHPKEQPVEVVLLSRNDPDTGLRVMNSIKHYGLSITRAVFTQGKSVYEYIPAFDISLFLSANEEDVVKAISLGYPAGQVLKSKAIMDDEGSQLRIAFDFDGVIADDESERVYHEDGLDKFYEHETNRASIEHNAGPLKRFLEKISHIQKLENSLKKSNSSYDPIVRVAIVTARGAPSHERVVHSLRAWNIMVNEAFFLGGIQKARVLEVLKPHIFFDDQRLHLDTTKDVAPAVHIPFGVKNSLV